MVFGYAYPAYECYKAVEKNKPEIEQLRFWCQYWYAFSMFGSAVCKRENRFLVFQKLFQEVAAKKKDFFPSNTHYIDLLFVLNM